MVQVKVKPPGLRYRFKGLVVGLVVGKVVV